MEPVAWHVAPERLCPKQEAVIPVASAVPEFIKVTSITYVPPWPMVPPGQLAVLCPVMTQVALFPIAVKTKTLGAAVVVEAKREFKELFRTEMGDAFHASPAFVADRIYLRGLTNVWCLGPTKP